jgi:Fe-Mn family superoxide dismutase
MFVGSKIFTCFALGCLGSLSFHPAQAAAPSEQNNAIKAEQKFTAKDYSYLIGMKGFSDQLLKNHFKLYEGYVKNAQLLLDNLAQLDNDGKATGPVFAEQQRRLGWEYNGMRLHELYFENLGGTKALDTSSSLYQLITQQFGSFDKWKQDFIAVGAMRGIGWAILYQDPVTGRLVNMWINEHDVGHLAGGTPLLIMDVFEHAYMIEYQLDKSAYIQAFMNNINWDVVAKRLPQNGTVKA